MRPARALLASVYQMAELPGRVLLTSCSTSVRIAIRFGQPAASSLTTIETVPPAQSSRLRSASAASTAARTRVVVGLTVTAPSPGG